MEKKKLKTAAILVSTRSHQQKEPSVGNTDLWTSLLLRASDLKLIAYQNPSSVLGASIIFRLRENDCKKQ